MLLTTTVPLPRRQAARGRTMDRSSRVVGVVVGFVGFVIRVEQPTG
jgi:hypothetical protein